MNPTQPNPNQQFQPSQPQVTASSPNPVGVFPPSVSPQSPASPAGSTSQKLFLPLCIIATVELLVIIGLLVALSTGHKAKTTAASNGTSSLAQDPQPATSTGVQQTSDAISQDITTLDTDSNFPANALEDTKLGL